MHVTLNPQRAGPARPGYGQLSEAHFAAIVFVFTPPCTRCHDGLSALHASNNTSTTTAVQKSPTR